MLISECLECGKAYKEVENGKSTQITHGYCPKCLEVIRKANKAKRKRKIEKGEVK